MGKLYNFLLQECLLQTRYNSRSKADKKIIYTNKWQRLKTYGLPGEGGFFKILHKETTKNSSYFADAVLKCHERLGDGKGVSSLHTEVYGRRGALSFSSTQEPVVNMLQLFLVKVTVYAKQSRSRKLVNQVKIVALNDGGAHVRVSGLSLDGAVHSFLLQRMF